MSRRFSNNKNLSSAKRGRGPSPAKASAAQIPRGSRAVVGMHAVNEAILVRPGQISKIILRKDWEKNTELVQLKELAEKNQVNCEFRPVGFLDSFAVTHQGVVALVEGRPRFDYELLAQEAPCVLLALDGIEDPHNLGAIMRTAWLLGVKGIFIPENRSTDITASAAKVACGAAEHIPVEKESSFQRFFEELKKNGFWIYGLSGNAENNLWQSEFSGKVLLVVGSEANGMRKTVEGCCDQLVKIPQIQPKASYNASVATAIALSEVCRQLNNC